MDQVAIGKFIASQRKERGLTQRELAEELGVVDKTVSKWERGRGLPEVALMLPLCAALGISVNELLSGQRLAEAEYKQKAEENMMNLIQEKRDSKRKLALQGLVAFSTLVGGITLFLTAGLLEMAAGARIGLIAAGLAVLLAGIAALCGLDRATGTFECRQCGQRFVPTAGAYIGGMHTITTRYLKCPACGHWSWCKKRLTH